MTPCRLIVDPPQDGAWNMAVDESLLDDAAEHGTASLRFYQWSEPTLSLGYFQAYADRFQHAASSHAPIVRRLSGGGALMHDREITYSLCLPASHPLARESQSLYEVVHHTLIGALSTHTAGLKLFAEIQPGATLESPDAADEPFLCFERRTAMDVVATGRGTPAHSPKVLGSAQRRRRGAVLQHGGVLLAASSCAPELPGLNECLELAITPDELVHLWQPKLAAALELELQPLPLDERLRQTAQQLRAEKYSARFWIERR
jgi:lipoate-protein ligase A